MPTPKTKKDKANNEFNAKVNKAINDLDKMIKGFEKEKIYKSFISEIPASSLNIFCSKGQKKFKQLYIDNRIAGVNKSDALSLTTSLVLRAYKDNKLALFEGIKKALMKIKDRIEKANFVGDDTQSEEFPPKEEIPVIEDDDKENESETTTKAISQDLLRDLSKQYDETKNAKE